MFWVAAKSLSFTFPPARLQLSLWLRPLQALEHLARGAAVATGECTSFEATRTCSVPPYMIPQTDTFLTTLERLARRKTERYKQTKRAVFSGFR